MRNVSHNNVVTLDGVELPKFVLDVLSLGPKHPVRKKFNEVNFFADADILVGELRENNTNGENLCEKNCLPNGTPRTYVSHQWIEVLKK